MDRKKVAEAHIETCHRATNKTRYSTDEPQKHSDRRMKPVAKNHTLLFIRKSQREKTEKV